MKLLHSLLLMTLVFILACGSGDVGGTQTGNPAVVALTYDMAYGTVARQSRGTGASVQSITIDEAYIALGEIRIDGVEDTLEFRSQSPYILTVTPLGISSLLDTLASFQGTQFEEIDISIEKTDFQAGATPLVDKSIYVKGYLNGDTLLPFEFTSELSERIRFRKEFEILNDSLTIHLAINLYDWFYDTMQAVLLDPRDADNKSSIEGFIKETFDAQIYQ